MSTEACVVVEMRVPLAEILNSSFEKQILHARTQQQFHNKPCRLQLSPLKILRSLLSEPAKHVATSGAASSKTQESAWIALSITKRSLSPSPPNVPPASKLCR